MDMDTEWENNETISSFCIYKSELSLHDSELSGTHR